MFAITSEAIEIAPLMKRLEDNRAGATVTFEGRVRNHNEGQKVMRLEYEAYEALSESEGKKIIAEAKEKFALYNCFCVHRSGSLNIGEVAVWVGVLAAHRDEAFKACRYIIDEVKQRLPIWKKEHYENGESQWVNCQAHQSRAACGALHAHE